MNGGLCKFCSHELDEHTLWATDDEAGNLAYQYGGIMLCYDFSCDCITTWSYQGMPVPPPDIAKFLLNVIAEKRGYSAMWIDYMMEKLYKNIERMRNN